MKTRSINPTPWLQHFGLNHGVEVSGATRTLYLSGQTASDAEGNPLYAGDLVAQFSCAWENLKDALTAADMAPANVVRLNFYTTDVDAFMEKADEMLPLLTADGCAPSSTLVGVTRLYHPDILIEIEATAVA